MSAIARPSLPARRARRVAAGLAAASFAGFATLAAAQTAPVVAPVSPAASDAAPADDAGLGVNDPFERFNRGMFSFNEAVDEAVLKPVATGYRKAVPELVRGWVSNFFNNLEDAWSLVNLVLQAKPRQAYDMTVRVTTNTVLGLGGILDIAGAAGIDRHEEDFGQTLGWWGVPPGPYLVLPLLGPSQIRETAALPLDRGWDYALIHDEGARIGFTVLDVVDTRAGLLTATGLLDTVALDKYSFVRDAYVQRRQSLVYDGNPPEPSTR